VPKIRGQRGVPACSAKISQFLFSMGKEKRRRPELLGVVNLALFRVSLRKKRKPLFGVSIILRCPLGSPVTRLVHTRTTTLVHDKHLHFGCDVHAPGLLSQRRKPQLSPLLQQGRELFLLYGYYDIPCSRRLDLFCDFFLVSFCNRLPGDCDLLLSWEFVGELITVGCHDCVADFYCDFCVAGVFYCICRAYKMDDRDAAGEFQCSFFLT